MKNVICVVMVALVGCQSQHLAATRDGSAAVAFDAGSYDQFGAGVHSGDAVPVAQLVANPEQFVGKPVRFRGPIQSVCQTKGCWMRIGEEPNVFVKFKDYAYFMPLDSAGREAIVEGELSVRDMSVAEARHYLEDAGKTEQANRITAPVREITFLASGVALQKRGP